MQIVSLAESLRIHEARRRDWGDTVRHCVACGCAVCQIAIARNAIRPELRYIVPRGGSGSAYWNLRVARQWYIEQTNAHQYAPSVFHAVQMYMQCPMSDVRVLGVPAHQCYPPRLVKKVLSATRKNGHFAPTRVQVRGESFRAWAELNFLSDSVCRTCGEPMPMPKGYWHASIRCHCESHVDKAAASVKGLGLFAKPQQQLKDLAEGAAVLSHIVALHHKRRSLQQVLTAYERSVKQPKCKKWQRIAEYKQRLGDAITKQAQ